MKPKVDIRTPYLASVVLLGGAILAAGIMVTAQEPSRQMTSGAAQPVTFAKDVAPILQRSCQNCHRPGSIAPMSLLTYEHARPWAQAIKAKAVAREMPPWFIDKNVGIQKFKSDPSLSDAEIATIVKWADSGAVQGNPSDMPPPQQFEPLDQWHIGKPDLIATSTPIVVPAKGADTWPTTVFDFGAREDRYIKAIEIRPTTSSIPVVHHAMVNVLEGPEDGGMDERRAFLTESAVGKNGDVFPTDSGRLLKANTRLSVGLHLHAVGKETPASVQVGVVFYPKGVVPKHVMNTIVISDSNEEELDIPAGATNVRTDAYFVLPSAARITAFQPHMHFRGKAMCLEAIYPAVRNQGGGTETLSCARFDFAWHLNYNYADDVAPLLPKGTILHVIGWHDNSARHRGNPNPKNWTGWGQRTIDDMMHAWLGYYALTDEELKREMASRRPTNTTK